MCNASSLLIGVILFTTLGFAGFAQVPTATPNRDLNSDGKIDGSDLLILIEGWHTYSPIAGELVWVRQVSGDASGYGIAALTGGSALIAGPFVGSATFGPGEPLETNLTAPFYGGFVARYNPEGTLAWAKSIANSTSTAVFDDDTNLAALSNGDYWLSGSFESGKVVFGQGEPAETILDAGESGQNLPFLARYLSDGSLLWAKQIGTEPGFGETYGIAVHSDESTCLTGDFASTVDFGLGELNQTTLESRGSSDVYLAKYNSNGSLAWARSAGGTSTDYGLGVAVHENGDVCVTGRFSDTATFGLGEANETTLNDGGFFVARYDQNGQLIWAKAAEGRFRESGGEEFLNDGSILVSGAFEDEATFGKDEVNQTSLTSLGQQDIFVAKYNPDGTLAWAKRAGGDGRDEAGGLSALSNGDFFLTGYFSQSAVFGNFEPGQTTLDSAGGTDIFLARFGQDGSLSWAKSAGGPSDQFFQGDETGSQLVITPDEQGLLLLGAFNDGAIFGVGEANETTLNTLDGDQNLFIGRFAP